MRAEGEGKLTGVPISARGYKLSHLLFTNDSLLFCRVNFLEWANIHHLLHLCECASSQKLNVEKTAIFFSRNTKREFKDHICSIVGQSAISSYERYLGLPALVGRSKNYLLLASKAECARGWGDGRRNSYHRPERRSWLNRRFKLSPTIA